jgi:oxygen-independent coproporphyrinogen III oxidase
MFDSVGIYISVPFCRAKCTYCNFASGVFGAERMDRYVECVAAEMRAARGRAEGFGAELPGRVDTVFLGGGTPSLLGAEQVARLFTALRSEFEVAQDAEITLECAPGQLSVETLDAMLRYGMNRVSFGVQSFVDREAAGVGRLHTREMCLAEIERMRRAGVENVNVDLIAGLPQQTAESWRESVAVAIESGVPHVSVYMLEVDEDSRLGREVLGAGTRYCAGAVPSEDESAEWYAGACEWLGSAGVMQYEISNFARPGAQSRHNLRYWRREPYLGVGLDAHSMLRSRDVGVVRFGNTDDLASYLAGSEGQSERVDRAAELEESWFLGLRLVEGMSLEALRNEFGAAAIAAFDDVIGGLVADGLLMREGERVALTMRGRMLSNEVFGRFLEVAEAEIILPEAPLSTR